MTGSGASDFLTGLHNTKSALERAIASRAGFTVQTGPFRGLMLPDVDVNSIAPKILGCYEAELHAALEAAISRQPDVVVNVGCAEGYYAVGLARRLPLARCIAFDSAESERHRCNRTARANGLEQRVLTLGSANSEHLSKVLELASNPLVICDCEGCEAELLDTRAIPALSHAELIVELHDPPGVTNIRDTLVRRFQSSHSLSFVRSGARDPGAFDLVKSLNQFLQLLAVCEFRDWTMEWAILTPLKPPQPATLENASTA